MNNPFDSLRDFIKALDESGELLRIKDRVSPEIDVSKITDAESKKPGGGKALLFENVFDGGKRSFPIATNLFGSEKRMSMALGVGSFSEAEKKIEEIVKLSPPKNFSEFFSTASKLLPLRKIFPRKYRRMGKTAPCQEVVALGEEVDLSEIPVLKCWPKDGGRFVTLPLVFTKSEDGKRRNLGMYRLQVYDKNTTGMHWHAHKDASHYFGEYSEKGRRMPVAVAIGSDPATIYAATAPMPRDVDELLLSGFFRGRGVELVKCKTIDMEVPANAEFVIEGYVEPSERRLEGPFGDHTGYYSMPDMYPVFHVTAVTRRKDPIYCATLVGPPPMEDCYMAKATERIFLPLLKTVMPEIRDIFMPWEGVFHNISIISIKKEFPAHAQKAMAGIWGQNQMGFCKCVVVVDENIDPGDLPSVWNLLLESFDPSVDIVRGFGILDALDHSSPTPLMGSKLGLDLTKKISGETPRNPSKRKISGACEKAILDALKGFPGLKKAEVLKGFVSIFLEKGDRKGSDILKEISEKIAPFESGIRALAIFDSDPANVSKMLWKIFNNCDPSRDFLETESGTFLLDACKKNSSDGYGREWPDDLSFE